MKLQRYDKNPILTPGENWWENKFVFNPGATLYNGKIVLLYRAQGADHISRFGLALSEDGFNFERFSEPAVDADGVDPYERLGIEDPRITRIGEIYYIFYTAASVYTALEAKVKRVFPDPSRPPWRIRTCLLTTKDFKRFDRHGVVFKEVDTKDSALFPEKIGGKFVLIHRVYPDMNLSFSEDLTNWNDYQPFIQVRPGSWDSERLGSGAPPVKTEKGWLLLYHGVDHQHIYRLGLLLLDLKDPTKILYRSSEPIFEPVEDFEKEGQVPNVVFSAGWVEKEDKFLVYYGAADKVIAVASLKKKDLNF